MKEFHLKKILLLIATTCCLQSYLEGSRHHEDGRFYSEMPTATGKIIREEGGGDVDCVDIHEQPTLKLLNLKNRTIQMDHPLFLKAFRHEKGNFTVASLKPGSNKDLCPKGTIPVRRRFKREFDTSILRPTLVHSNGSTNRAHSTRHKYSGISQSHDQHDISGASAYLNVWEPWTDFNEASIAQVRLANVEDAANVESISAGWMVSSSKYGDKRPRLFTYFTNNKYHDGCFNLECPGFVQIHETIRPGEAIVHPVSIYGGEQRVLNINIAQDLRYKNWWLQVGDTMIGYWAPNFFPKLNLGSNLADWSGIVLQRFRSEPPTGTQMGSGHFPNEGEGKAAYIGIMKYVDTGYRVHDLDQTHTVYSSNPNCYGVTDVSPKGPQGTLLFFYGGPGKIAPGCN